MPPKVRDLENHLQKAGFDKSAAKGSHRKWRHAKGVVLIISGKGGDDAKPYQEKAVAEAVEKVRSL